MINFLSQTQNRNLILFIHGFTGDENTWKNESGDSFAELLIKDCDLSAEFDVASFYYYSKLKNLSARFEIVRRLFSKTYQASRKNIPIREIANLLRTELKFTLAQYENVVVIAHSMGGLVAKCAILDELSEGNPSKIQLYISLAVPHSGAISASFAKLIIKDSQIKDLSALGEFVVELNQKWIETSFKPVTKYFYALHDQYVVKGSAVPIDKPPVDAIAIDEDHTSICKPKDEKATVLSAVRKIIFDYFNSDIGLGGLQLQSLSSDAEYSDELFVLKLIVADVHSVAIKDAKEMFLNAEYMRKRFNSETDVKRLDDLYKRVKKVYTDNYSKFQHGLIGTPGALLDAVKGSITSEDLSFLKCNLIPALHAMHKQGMLHQLANVQDQDIWWTKESGLDFLEKASGAPVEQ